MRKNKLREILKSGKPSMGTSLLTTWPSAVEVIGHTGTFDYVEFDAEYGAFDLYALDDFCRAAELYDLSTMIKVDQACQRFHAQRAIGSGFQGVIMVDCRSAEDARQCVRAVRPETPEGGGLHGVGIRRIAYVSEAGTADYVQALKDVVIVLMIEKKAAVDNLEEILSVDGIDMIQWGPTDYSMSIGQPTAYRLRGKPEIKAVERKVYETAARMGVPARAEIESPDQASYYLELGVRHFHIGLDIAILYGWWKKNGEELRKIVSDV